MEKQPDRRKFLKIGGAAVAMGAVNVPGRLLAALEKETTASRFAMVIDLRRCVGCRGCTVACKSEYNDPLGHWRSCVQQKDKGKYPQTRRHFLPLLCNHCADPPCVKACPVDPIKRTHKGIEYEGKATYQRPDGAVLMDESICVGCGACIEECPYGARFFHPLRKAGAEPENDTVSKCTFCNHRVDQGVVPSCVNTCLAKARTFGDLNDPASEVSKLLKANKTEVLLPKKGTNPKVLYIGFEPGVYQEYKEGEAFHDEIK
jgi:tetrathionate reductase subunit B